MEAPIQELEKEFDQINFEKIMSNNKEENIPDKEKHTELTTNVTNADLELNILLKADKSLELGDVDIKQNQENVDVQFHDSDLDRNFLFIDDQQMISEKKIESPEMQTQVDEKMVTAVDGDLTVLKLSKFQTHTLLNEQVLYIML